MARSIRSTTLETRTNRLRLPPRVRPYAVRVAPGVRLAYRRRVTAGSWSVLAADGNGGAWIKIFADADDFENADGENILDFWQAQERARALARGGDDKPTSNAPKTAEEALDEYEDDLKARGGEAANVSRVRSHLTPALLGKPVALLEVDELKRFRNRLKKARAPSTVNRIANGLRAALNLAADGDKRIVSRQAWQVGLKSIPHASRARNVILRPAEIRLSR
jgi:hypothetical protein